MSDIGDLEFCFGAEALGGVDFLDEEVGEADRRFGTVGEYDIKEYGKCERG